jgi:hypothetical protein
MYKCHVFLTVVEKIINSILYTKVEKFMIIARAPRLETEARRGYKGLLHRGLYTIFFTTRSVKTLSDNNY